MDLRQDVHRLLKEIGPNRSLMSNTAYDTAWVARLNALDHPMGAQALDWLRAHQLADGSWGATELPYYHDRFICTLAAITVLGRYGRGLDHIRRQRGRLALEVATKGLEIDMAGDTIGFEMIAPTMLAEAESFGLIQPQRSDLLDRLSRQRAAKLAALPGGMINRFVTVAFSAEMAGPDGLHLLDVENLQEVNGSVGHSPSATAYFVLYVRPLDPAALSYLHRTIGDGGVPTVAPSDVFEMGWVLWNLALVGDLDDEALALCKPHLDFLQAIWDPKQGIPQASGYTPRDSDDTSLVYEVLLRCGRSASLDAVLHYEEDTYFRCFALEANPSVSANIHVLGALRQAGLKAEHPSVTKVIQYLFASQAIQLFWFDKWHVSPYYPTAHAVIAGAGYVDWLVDGAAYWMLETQKSDGSWGYYMSTAEETAYCLQALIIWKRHGHPVPDDVIRRGATWLSNRLEPPYPPLWIGKCLYCPKRVVRSTILSALMLVAQE
jgi:halimadienyl-diphosphate synthase